jgi:cellulose synthase (UDP-forming)
MMRTTHVSAFEENQVSKPMLFLTIIMAIVYFIALVFVFEKGNYILFGFLIAGEVFHLWQLFTFIFTIWNTGYKPRFDDNYKPAVDVFVTVAGEPVDIVEETVRGILAMNYPDFHVYILNDGFVAKKSNWEEIEALATELGVACITRKTPGGAKAGNINSGLAHSRSPYVAIFDADHVPHVDFLSKTMGYFGDHDVGFVQSPQYYKNKDLNAVTRGAWEQQELFFGPICRGKNNHNAASMCGTNMVVSREALREVGGMCTESIAEDFITGAFIHACGWKSVYVPEVLAEGLAPEDFLSYYKQQFRWARGALDVIFKYNIFFMPGLKLAQRIEYSGSASYFMSGIIVAVDALIPIAFFFTGLVPFQISTMLLAAIFLPYIFVNLYILRRSANFATTFHSIAYSMAAFNIHIKALVAAMFNQKSTFSITSKKQVEGNFINLVIPHIVYIGLVAVGLGVALSREGFSPSVLSNLAWALLNVTIFLEFIKAALPKRETESAIALQKA